MFKGFQEQDSPGKACSPLACRWIRPFAGRRTIEELEEMPEKILEGSDCP
jgi:hypothetical protein